MAKFLALLTGLTIWTYQAHSQIIKSPLSLLGLPFAEQIVEPSTFFNGQRTYIDAPRPYFDLPIEAVRNYNMPRIIEAPNYLPPVVGEPAINKIVPSIPHPSTTVITDCTPSICKNLADTINLLVVSNLLQNTLGGEQVAMQIAAPILKDIMARQNFPGAPISSFANANFGPLLPNIVAPNYASNMIVPNVPSNVYAPSPIAPPTIGSSPVNNGALISSILNILNGAAF